MRDVLFIVTNSTIHAQDLETGSKLANVNDSFSSRVNGTACIGEGLLKSGMLVVADRGKPLLRFYKSEKIDSSVKRVTLPEVATCLAVSSDGVILAVGTHSGNLHIWDLTTGAFLRTFRNPRFPTSIDSLNIGGQSTFLFAVYHNAILTYVVPDLISLAAPGSQSIQSPVDCYRSFERHRGRVSATAFCVEGSTGFAVSGDLEGVCLVWKIEDGEVIGEMQFASGITCLSLERNQHTRLIVGLSASPDIYDIDLKLLIGRYKGIALSPEGYPVFCGASCSPHLLKIDDVGTTLISAGADEVNVWSLETRQLLRSVPKTDGTEVFTSLEIVASHPTLKETADQVAPLGLPRTDVMPNFRALEQLVSSNEQAWRLKLISKNAPSRLADIRRQRVDPMETTVKALWQQQMRTVLPEKALAEERRKMAEAQQKLTQTISLLDSTLRQMCAPPDEDESIPSSPTDSQSPAGNLNEVERKIVTAAVAIAMGNNGEPPSTPDKAVVTALEKRPSWYLKPSNSWSRNKMPRTEAAG